MNNYQSDEPRWQRPTDHGTLAAALAGCTCPRCEAVLASVEPVDRHGRPADHGPYDELARLDRRQARQRNNALQILLVTLMAVSLVAIILAVGARWPS